MCVFVVVECRLYDLCTIFVNLCVNPCSNPEMLLSEVELSKNKSRKSFETFCSFAYYPVISVRFATIFSLCLSLLGRVGRVLFELRIQPFFPYLTIGAYQNYRHISIRFKYYTYTNYTNQRNRE